MIPVAEAALMQQLHKSKRRKVGVEMYHFSLVSHVRGEGNEEVYLPRS